MDTNEEQLTENVMSLSNQIKDPDVPIDEGSVLEVQESPRKREEQQRQEEHKRERFLISWGCGEFGQNGHPGNKDRSFMSGLLSRFSSKCVKLVSCGSSHTVVVTETNEIYAWGNGKSGQLGCGDKDNHPEPVQIFLVTNQAQNPPIGGVACGGRHTFIWLTNGHMFSFGNNYFAQLGYDFRIKNYKENQMKPHLLRTLTYRSVQHVACGEKHTLFLFQGGIVATVGNSAYGQIGDEGRQEAVVPRFIDDLPVCKYIACGSNHNLVIDENGEVWQWGYGKACGSKNRDLLYPQKAATKRRNIVKVAGGQLHSMALTANGNVYVWGAGIDGQLGQGEAVKFLSSPTRLAESTLSCSVAEIACGECYSTAVSGDGLLYMWGKNSHLIRDDKEANCRIFQPHPVDMAETRVRSVECGAWHAAALTGDIDWEKENDDSDEEISDNMDCDSCTSEELGFIGELGFLRSRTKTTLGEFYAPSPSPVHKIGQGGRSRSGSQDLSARNTGRRISDPRLHPSPRASFASIVSGDGDHFLPAAGADGSSTHPALKQRTSLSSIKDSEALTLSQISLNGGGGDGGASSSSQLFKPMKYVHFGDCAADGSDTDGALEGVSRVPPSSLDNLEIEWHLTKFTPPVKHTMNGAGNNIKKDKGPGTVQTSSTYADNFVLPREKSMIVNKNLDFVPNISSLSLSTKDGKTLHYAKLTREPTFVAEGKQDNSIDRGKGLRTPRDRANQAAVIAYRRGQKFMMNGDGVVKEGKRTKENHPKWDIDSSSGASVGGETFEPQSALPRTVSLKSGELDDTSKPLSSLQRQVSIPGKPLLQKQPTILELAVDKPNRRAFYSSASSWKHEADRAKVNGMKKTRTDPRWMGIKMVNPSPQSQASVSPGVSSSPARSLRQQPALQSPLARKKELREPQGLRPKIVQQMSINDKQSASVKSEVI